MSSSRIAFLFSLLLATAGGCNLFDPLDSPTSDAQLLSAARACFDKGDLTCAREKYTALSSSYDDVKNSEKAFTILDENGATMAVFMEGFGNGSAGTGLTTLANTFAKGTTGSTLRLALYEAYKYVALISDTNLKGLVRFTVSASIAGAVLAEIAGSDDSLKKTDIATSTSCTTSTTCATDATCDNASGGLDTGSIVDLDSTTSATAMLTTTTAHMGMLGAAINEIDFALSDEFGASGSFSSGSGAFADAFSTLSTTTTAGLRCYRYNLLSNGVGA